MYYIMTGLAGIGIDLNKYQWKIQIGILFSSILGGSLLNSQLGKRSTFRRMFVRGPANLALLLLIHYKDCDKVTSTCSCDTAVIC